MKSEKTVSRKSQKFRSAFHFLEIKQKSGNVNIFKFNFCVSSLLLTWSFPLKRRSFQGFAARKGKFMMIDKGKKWQKKLKVKNILFWTPDKRYSGCVWPKRIVEHLDDKYHADKYSVPTPLLCAYQPPLAPPNPSLASNVRGINLFLTFLPRPDRGRKKTRPPFQSIQITVGKALFSNIPIWKEIECFDI